MVARLVLKLMIQWTGVDADHPCYHYGVMISLK